MIVRMSRAFSTVLISTWRHGFSANQNKGQINRMKMFFLVLFAGQNSPHLFNELKCFILSSEINQELLHYKQ